MAWRVFRGSYDLEFSPYKQRVTLADQTITSVEGLDRSFALEIVLKDDLNDVCIDNHRCLIGRYPEQYGDQSFLYAHCAELAFENIAIARLI